MRVWLGFSSWFFEAAKAGEIINPCDSCIAARVILAHRRERGLRCLDRDLRRSWLHWQARPAAFVRRAPVWRSISRVAAARLVRGHLADADVRELIETAAFHDGDRRTPWEKIGFGSHPLEAPAGGPELRLCPAP